MIPLTNPQIRALKAQAQRLKATLKIGKDGLSPQFLTALDETLEHHELVKVKFDDFKERRKELSPQLAEKSGSHLVTRVGNVVVLYRPKSVQEKQPEYISPAQQDHRFGSLISSSGQWRISSSGTKRDLGLGRLSCRRRSLGQEWWGVRGNRCAHQKG